MIASVIMKGRHFWTLNLLLILFALCYSVQGSACGIDHFNCTSSGNSSSGASNSTCIPRRFVCDGKSDCSDGLDENNCPSTSDVGEPCVMLEFSILNCRVIYNILCLRQYFPIEQPAHPQTPVSYSAVAITINSKYKKCMHNYISYSNSLMT